MDAVARSAQKSRQLYITVIYMHIILCACAYIYIYIHTCFSWFVHVATRDQIGSKIDLDYVDCIYLYIAYSYIIHKYRHHSQSSHGSSMNSLQPFQISL